MRYEEIEEWLTSVGERPQRAAQLFAWMYRRGKLVERAEDMADVSLAFRDKLARVASLEGDPDDGGARGGGRHPKVLYRLKNGGGVVESVIIPSNVPDGRTTVCVSSQLGCAMNCQFCFTAKMGLRRNLTAAQIVEQVVNARRLTGEARAVQGRGRQGGGDERGFHGDGRAAAQRRGGVGGGGHLDGYPRLALSQNKVTVSTSGLVPEIERYLRESRGSLAVSLNATTNEIRSWIMPINRKYNLERLLGALRDNFLASALGGISDRCSSSTSAWRASTTATRMPSGSWTSLDPCRASLTSSTSTPTRERISVQRRGDHCAFRRKLVEAGDAPFDRAGETRRWPPADSSGRRTRRRIGNPRRPG